MNKLSEFLVFLVVLTMAVTIGGCNQSRIVDVKAKATFEPLSKSEISWAMYPGGGMESLDSPDSFCINLSVSKETGDLIAKNGFMAYIEAGPDHLLRIFVSVDKESSFLSVDGGNICLDLDGYGTYLSKAITKRDVPLKLYLDFGGKILVAELPESKDIANTQNREIDINFIEGNNVPNENEYKPVKATDWPKIGGMFGPPALMRKQDGISAIYFFHVKNRL